MENTNASTENTYSDEFPETVILPISTAMRLYNNKNLSGFFCVNRRPGTDRNDETKEL